jgi:hypothetical protein
MANTDGNGRFSVAKEDQKWKDAELTSSFDAIEATDWFQTRENITDAQW